MPQDNERIIEISAELLQVIKDGVIELLRAGAPGEMVAGLLHATENLERVPERLASHGEGCVRVIEGGMATAEFIPGGLAIAALSEKVDEILRLSRVGIEACKP